MSGLTVTRLGRIAPVDARARLVCPGLGSLYLPWWPDGIERGALTPNWVDNPRPGDTPDVSRGSEPLPTQRLNFTVSDGDVEVSVEEWLSTLEEMANALKPMQFIKGEVDTGRWICTDLGVTEKQWTSLGQVNEADVVLALRRPSEGGLVVGPVKKRRKK